MTKQKPPERLEKRLARVAREQGIDQERLRRWVSFLALCGALDRAIQAGVLAAYYLKGGVAMELRFAEHARATKDLDLGMEGTRASRLQSLSDALGVGFDQFAFRIKARTRDMEQADTIRVLVSIQYRTRSWQTIEVDLGPANVDRVDLIEPRVRGLVELGIPLTSPVRCLGLAEQVAQKLHACTGPAAAGRARDVQDILLIDALGQLNYAETARVARRVFEERATHAFPPGFAMPADWAPELESLALELGFTLSTAAEIEGRFLEVIRMLEHATPIDD
jgi:nucleotidyltransferase AbiEii toxin of type IV toxin-antitoxin system